MHPLLQQTSHRPWALPSRPWTVHMRWLDLAFIHCRIDASILERALPSGLALDRYEGEAWLGLVPFRMASVAPRGLPAFPRFSTFPEINVRTYVIADGKPGVWFFSLDADSAPTVFAGRTFLDLPYHLAGIQLTRDADALRFNSVRRRGDAHFRGSYRPVGEVFHATHGSFEHWAAERYCLYSHSPPPDSPCRTKRHAAIFLLASMCCRSTPFASPRDPPHPDRGACSFTFRNSAARLRNSGCRAASAATNSSVHCRVNRLGLSLAGCARTSSPDSRVAR